MFNRIIPTNDFAGYVLIEVVLDITVNLINALTRINKTEEMQNRTEALTKQFENTKLEQNSNQH